MFFVKTLVKHICLSVDDTGESKLNTGFRDRHSYIVLDYGRVPLSNKL